MKILYRQPIWSNGEFLDWHYWGIDIEQGGEQANVGWLTYKQNVTDPKESQQYINIFNRYNQDLYVGDIVKYRILVHDYELDDEDDTWCEYNYDVIEFSNGKFCKSKSEGYNNEPHQAFHYCRTVGNIYQNPEMISLIGTSVRTETHLSDDIEP